MGHEYLQIHFLKMASVTTEASFEDSATSSTYFVKASVIAKMYFLLLPEVLRVPYKSQCILMFGSVGSGRGLSRVGDETGFFFLIWHL